MSQRKVLRLSRAGNPILREKMPKLTIDEIKSKTVQDLIADIRYTNQQKQYGVGLAAPQVGVRLALSVIGIKPTPNHPEFEIFEQVIINPSYRGIARRTGLWEGCQSIGSEDDILFAKAMRYREVEAEWIDEDGERHQERLNGFVAHVFQHETDHINGVLFIDRVNDKKTFMMADEYRKRIVKKG